MQIHDLERLGKTYRERDSALGAELDPLLQPVVATARELTALANSQEYTATGIRARADDRLARAERVIEPFEQGTNRLFDELTRDEDAAARGPAADTSRHAEIRAWLAQKAPHEQRAEYFAAIEAGDWETIAAIETAPSSMNLLDDVTRLKGRARKLAKAPPEATAALEATRARVAARQYVADSARRLLKDLRFEATRIAAGRG